MADDLAMTTAGRARGRGRSGTGQLPGGLLTFLFTDIEGSTRLLQELGEAWGGVLDAHHRLLREVAAGHDGTVVSTEGDSFLVAFPTADAAIAAAVSAQRRMADEAWPGDIRLRIRIGLHTGTASVAGGTYTGLDVHRAARIMAAAHGGQVVLSATALDGSTSLPDGVRVRDLGEHWLKDIAVPERVHQLVIDGLPAEFPALRALEAGMTNLPLHQTAFLGRERELADVGALLEASRLVTLTGPGGTGKTRLAVQSAARAAGRFPDGAWFVALATIGQPDLVAAQIARVLGVPEHGSRPALDRIIEYLGDRRVLLLLDNFEHVVDAAPEVSRLLAEAPNVVVLITSRGPLHLYGEQDYAVPPLALPGPRDDADWQQLARNEAVALFVERARAADPGFDLSADNAAAVAEICRRLDGLPLAIELAAARIRLLAPAALLARLEDRLGLLDAGPRDLPRRQQALRATIGWSHDLLGEEEQRLFASLSVFVGGASLAAIEGICAVGEPGSLFRSLDSLVDQSLIRRVSAVADEARFGMLETIREFAAERLAALDDEDAVRRRHAEFFAEHADALAAAGSPPADPAPALSRLEQEHGNFRAAIGWAVAHDRPDLALRLPVRLWRMWQMRGHVVEGHELAREALSMPGAVEHPELRADALEAAGGLAYWRGDTPATRRWYEAALEARRALGDRRGVAEALYNLSFAFASLKPGNTPEDVERARGLIAEALELFGALGDEGGAARAGWMHGSLEAVRGDFDAALRGARQAVDTFRRLDDRFYLGWGLWSVSLALLGLRRGNEARESIREALAMFRAVDDVSGILSQLEAAAVVAHQAGDAVRATRLAAGVSRLEAETALDVTHFPRKVLDFRPDELGAAQPEAWEAGQRLDLAALIDEALEILG